MTKVPGGNGHRPGMIATQRSSRWVGVEMRVLVVGAEGSAVDRMTAALQDAHHQVVRCDADGEPAFPCPALVDQRRCPVDGTPVDVVVDAHDPSDPSGLHFEAGLVCALRRGVPLVVAGDAVWSRRRWATVEVGPQGDVVAACESAAKTSVEPDAAARAAADAARAVLSRFGVNPVGTSATIRRQGDNARVLLELPPRPPGLHWKILTEVVHAVRSVDGDVATVDVTMF